MWELFCPQHGIPAYVSMALPYIAGVWIEAQMVYIRLMELFGRYL